MSSEMKDILFWPDDSFKADDLAKYVYDFAKRNGMRQSLYALNVMTKCHEGQFRKSVNDEKIPYIVHPLTAACHAIAINIADDNLLAAVLLHDVFEDCDISEDELEVSDEVKIAVQSVSFCFLPGLSEKETYDRYYETIGKNKLAAMVKLLDRCNNISTMATGFSENKIHEYIKETQQYFFPLIELVKNEYEEYRNAAFVIEYQIKSVIDGIKRFSEYQTTISE